MTDGTRSIGFGQHALAILGGAMLGATIFGLGYAAWAGAKLGSQTPGAWWLALVAVAGWLTVFIVSLPSAGIVLSLLYPVVRRGTPAAACVSVLAGVAMGTLISPLGSRGTPVTGTQILVFAAVGALVARCYVLIGRRLGAVPASPA